MAPSLPPSLTHSLTPSLTHSLTHSLTLSQCHGVFTEVQPSKMFVGLAALFLPCIALMPCIFGDKQRQEGR